MHAGVYWSTLDSEIPRSSTAVKLLLPNWYFWMSEKKYQYKGRTVAPDVSCCSLQVSSGPDLCVLACIDYLEGVLNGEGISY